MSAPRAAAAYDQVVRRIKFSETHPNVHIDHVTAPHWHWTATWVNQADEQVTKTHRELRGLLDALDAVDWDAERPKRQRPPVQPPPDSPSGIA